MVSRPLTNGLTAATMLGARRKASQRQRRLILDDDGDLVYDQLAQGGPEAFCELRLKDCLGTPVDSIAWCIMWAIAIKGSTPTRYWQTQKLGLPLLPNMTDPTPVVAQFCRQHGIEVFGSIRMNDCHDAFGLPFENPVYPLKVEHPEMLLGDQSQQRSAGSGLEAAMWSGLNYALATVREDRYWWIDHTASSYDLDGVDLNFFRMPWFFKVGQESQHMHLMTDLIRRARRRLDEISLQRGQPMLLGVRVPDTIETCLGVGLDIETWLKEDLVDRMLTGGGYVAFSTPAEELVELGHKYGVPVYPCINCPLTYKLGGEKGAEALRGAASNLWWAGADGLYLWNFHYLGTEHPYGQPRREDYQLLTEIGEPKNLMPLDKTFVVNTSEGFFEQYARASAPCPLPLELGQRVGQGLHKVPLRIGDDIPTAASNGMLQAVTLRMKFSTRVKRALLHVRFNGLDLDSKAGTKSDPYWLELPLKAELVRQGLNDLQVVLARRGPIANETMVLEQVWVVVRYR